MKKKTVWYLGGVLILGLAVLAVSCGQSIFPKEPAVEQPAATITPPLIPHSLEGRANCLTCHEAGIGGAPQFPANHSGRPSDVCLACHQPTLIKNGNSALTTIPAPPVETTPPVKTAGDLYTTSCAGCHGRNRQGISGLGPALIPESLAGMSDAEIRDAILKGRSGTTMPAFKGTISPEEIDALLQLIKYTSP